MCGKLWLGLSDTLFNPGYADARLGLRYGTALGSETNWGQLDTCVGECMLSDITRTQANPIFDRVWRV